MRNYKDFFNIKDNFTLTELKNARNKKLFNLLKLNIANIDKQMYSIQINKIYRIAKLDILARTAQKYNIPYKFYNKFNYKEEILEEIRKNNNDKE